jgi:hypothetical protein
LDILRVILVDTDIKLQHWYFPQKLNSLPFLIF